LILAMLVVTSLLSLNLMGISVQDAYENIVNKLLGEEIDQCQTLYENTFDGDLNDWQILEQEKFWRGNFRTQNGQLIGNPWGALILDQYSGNDYLININNPTLQQTGMTYNGYGVIFRSSYDKKDRLDGYMFEFEKVYPFNQGVMYFSAWQKGYQIKPPLAEVSVPTDFDWKNPGDLSINVSGDTFTAYLNGENVLQAQDDRYDEGKVGLAVNSGSRLILSDFGIDDTACQE
jgi:hypothetical protein